MRREMWAQRLDMGATTDRDFATSLRAANEDHARDARVDRLLEAFFTKGGEGEPRGENGSLTTKDLRRNYPAIETDLRREQDRLIILRKRWRAALTLERSEASVRRRQGDTLELCARESGARRARFQRPDCVRAGAGDPVERRLVLHKLDYGLDHLLLDEAQDASASQWGILTALSAEFFAGAGARNVNRTVFAVGDEKQSIFAFQGAARRSSRR